MLAALAEIETTARESLTGMRRLVGMLRAVPDAEPQPGLHQLDDLAAKANATVTVRGRPRPLPVDVDLFAYRIIQQALIGAGRGAHRVTLIYHSDAVTVQVDDDIWSTDPDQHAATVIAIRERAVLLGGQCTAQLTPAGGRFVSARLPVEGALT